MVVYNSFYAILISSFIIQIFKRITQKNVSRINKYIIRIFFRRRATDVKECVNEIETLRSVIRDVSAMDEFAKWVRIDRSIRKKEEYLSALLEEEDRKSQMSYLKMKTFIYLVEIVFIVVFTFNSVLDVGEETARLPLMKMCKYLGCGCETMPAGLWYFVSASSFSQIISAFNVA